jgi:TctA family transporter
MLLPATFVLPPVSALIMLAGIYYGAQYGGSTTAILVNLPGEVSSVVTCLDGYQMARQGMAGKALGIAALGSFFAGSVATILIAGFAPPLAEFALKFGPADYFSLMVLGLIAAVVLAHGSIIKAIAMIVLGLLLGIVGTDVNSGVARYSFGMPELIDGSASAPSRWACSDSRRSSATSSTATSSRGLHEECHRFVPNWSDIKRCAMPTIRGTALGSVLGILPGGGPVLGSFSAYTLEKKVSKDAREIRHRNDGGRSGARVGEQCRGADLVHPAPHPRHSLQSGDGADDRRDDHPRHPARPADHDREARALLGNDREHVGGQLDACPAQPADDRDVGEAAHREVRLPVPRDPHLLLHRRLLDQQRLDGRPARRALRVHRLRFVKLEVEPAPLLLGFVLGR